MTWNINDLLSFPAVKETNIKIILGEIYLSAWQSEEFQGHYEFHCEGEFQWVKARLQFITTQNLFLVLQTGSLLVIRSQLKAYVLRRWLCFHDSFLQKTL